MKRPTRRLSIALLWLAIALVPLRGWAGAWMPMAMGADRAAIVAMADGTPPCHAAMVDVGHDGDAGEVAVPQTCSMCDLCHAQAVQAPEARTLPAAPHDGVPHATADAPIEPRAPDALYRPPRHLRA